MKTLKLITSVILLCSLGAFAQTPAPATPPPPPQAPAAPAKQPGGAALSRPGQLPMAPGRPGMKMNRYMVQIPHTKEDCKKVMSEMKEKGPAAYMRFEWGCASGDHTGYALMPGESEDAVRKQLPDALQKTAKITKVDRYNAADLQKQN